MVLTRQEQLGRLILDAYRNAGPCSFQTVAEAATYVLTYRPHLLTGAQDTRPSTKEQYLSHLQQQGDKYSLEMREAILKGEKIDDDPSGN